MGHRENELIEMHDGAWPARIGQLQTVLSYFGALCSVSVERADGVTVYVQAQRVDGGLELETVGNTYLPVAAQLTDAEVAAMGRLGWDTPEPPVAPNFTRTVAEGVDLHQLAVSIACTFQEVYGVRGHEAWVVSPPEFGQVSAGLEPLEILDLDDGEEEDRMRVLREGSGVPLAAAVAGDAVSFEDCLAAGLPRGDRIAEMAMLYRQDCRVEFLRKSSFHLNVLADPLLPLSTARAVLAARPTAYEIGKLSARPDISRESLTRAARRGHRLARGRGESGGGYLRLGCISPQQLAELAVQQDGEAVGMLSNPRCPEEVVLRYILARSAFVRYAALVATKRRNLAVDVELIRGARDIPMADRKTFPYAERVRRLADQILAAGHGGRP